MKSVTDPAPQRLTDLPGIDEQRARRLRAHGIETPEHVAAAGIDQLAAVNGISRGLAGRLRKEVDGVEPTGAVAAEVEQLEELSQPEQPFTIRLIPGDRRISTTKLGVARVLAVVGLVTFVGGYLIYVLLCWLFSRRTDVTKRWRLITRRLIPGSPLLLGRRLWAIRGVAAVAWVIGGNILIYIGIGDTASSISSLAAGYVLYLGLYWQLAEQPTPPSERLRQLVNGNDEATRRLHEAGYQSVTAVSESAPKVLAHRVDGLDIEDARRLRRRAEDMKRT